MATVSQSPRDSSTVSSVRFDGFISYSHAADDLLAPRLQGAVQSFAKPWWKRRALRIFRDQSSLSANPHLWSSITDALDSSEWFILLTSPDAASSRWVDREVAYWLGHRDPGRILPILTDGTIAWDEEASRLQGSAVPPSLGRAFANEPRWVDLSWVEDETQLDLRNARFRDVVADVASALRGVPKDDLESEEVRQHRRTRRTAWGAGILLLVLSAAAVAGAVVAVDQRDEAEVQRANAEAEAARAVTAESRARSRELAASAINVLHEDPELSILLGLEAIAASPEGEGQPLESLNALREGVHASRLISSRVVSPAGGLVAVDVSPDESRLATVAHNEGIVSVFDNASGDLLGTYSDPETVDSLFSLSFSANGDLLAIGVTDSARPKLFGSPGLPVDVRPGASNDDGMPPRIILLRADTFEVVRTIEYPGCNESTPIPKFSPDGAWLAIAGLKAEACGPPGQWAVELFDTSSFELVQRWTTDGDLGLSWTSDASLLAVGNSQQQGGTTVFDIETRQPVHTFDSFAGAISPDGSRLVFDNIRRLDVVDMATGTVVDRLTGIGNLPVAKTFSGDGSRVIVATLEEAFVFDVASGGLLHRLGPSESGTVSLVCVGPCDTLYQSTGRGRLNIWDLSVEAGGEFDSVATGYFVNAQSVRTAGDRGVFLGFSSFAHPDVVPFDTSSGRLHEARRRTETNNPTPLPDGRIILWDVADDAPEWGPVVAWDPDTDEVEEVIGCWATHEAIMATGGPGAPCADREGTYFFPDFAALSPDQSTLLLVSGNDARILDAATLEVVAAPTLPPDHRFMLNYGGDYLVSTDGESSLVVEVANSEVVATLIGPGLSEISADGQVMVIHETGRAIHVYETSSWNRTMTFPLDPTRGLALSPDGSRLLTGEVDNYARVFDTRTGAELARIPLPSPSDGYWRDENHVVVGNTEGLWTTLTLDVDELVDLALSRLTRGFSVEECEVYLIDPCPDLEEIRGRR